MTEEKFTMAVTPKLAWPRNTGISLAVLFPMSPFSWQRNLETRQVTQEGGAAKIRGNEGSNESWRGRMRVIMKMGELCEGGGAIKPVILQRQDTGTQSIILFVLAHISFALPPLA